MKFNDLHKEYFFLYESPDYVAKVNVAWDSNDATTFIYFKNPKIWLHSEKGNPVTHAMAMGALKEITKDQDKMNQVLEDGKMVVTDGKNNYNLYWSGNLQSLNFSNLTEDNVLSGRIFEDHAYISFWLYLWEVSENFSNEVKNFISTDDISNIISMSGYNLQYFNWQFSSTIEKLSDESEEIVLTYKQLLDFLS